jgi:hypothetical protein
MSSPSPSQDDRPDGAAAESTGAPQERSPHDGLADAWAAAAERWSELREYAAFYLAAQADQLRLAAHTTLIRAVLIVVVAIIAVSSIAAASVLVVLGAATGVGQLLGEQIWLGQLLVGCGTISLAGGGFWLLLLFRMRTYRRALIEKYELRKQTERGRYGTDVAQRAKQRSQES